MSALLRQTPSGTMPALRSLPVPVTEPAVSTILRTSTPVHATQGALALAFAVSERSLAQDPVFGPQPTSSDDLPDPEATCSALVQAVVEVLGGVRPPTQLVRWLSNDVHAALTRRAALAARMRRGATPTIRASVVRAVRVCLPADGVAEGSAVIVDGDRVRAVAIRLEGLDGRWRATALEVG